MNTKENNSKQNDGLPDVAQAFNKHKTLIVVMMVVVIVIFVAMHFGKRNESKSTTHVEETYTVQNEQGSENKVVPVKPEKQADVVPEPKVTHEQIAFIREKQRELQERLASPLMIVSNSSSETKITQNEPATSLRNTNDANTQFLNQVSNEKHGAVNAATLASLNTVIAEGSLIHATLENATNSDLPGFLRAIVSKPAYSEDGSQVLIPPGSRLIGQYKSGMLQGQSRIFIVWTRLITPSGISVSLGSAGIDNLGLAGTGADEINRHFWLRFGTASLLSIIGAGASNLGASNVDRENSISAYRSAVANSFAQAADQSLQQQGNIPPTLKTYQGKSIMVFVAHDLNFQTAIKQITPKMNVF